ncbi:MAG: histidine phosphatase family protein [Polyangiaceae bacterium]
MGGAVDPKARARATELLLQRMMLLWAQDAFPTGQLETWHQFRERLASALEGITSAPGSGQNVAVFSSGGAIGALIAGILGVREQAVLELGYAVQNTGVSELRYSGPGRVSLSRFNSLAHLPDPGTWTYR